MTLIWPKAEWSLAPAPTDVNHLARPLLMTMLAPSPSFSAAQERPLDSRSD